MSEWLKEHAWRACRGLKSPSWVRIPVSPKSSKGDFAIAFNFLLDKGLGYAYILCRNACVQLVSTISEVNHGFNLPEEE